MNHDCSFRQGIPVPRIAVIGRINAEIKCYFMCLSWIRKEGDFLVLQMICYFGIKSFFGSYCCGEEWSNNNRFINAVN